MAKVLASPPALGVLFLAETKDLECPCGLKRKLEQGKLSLVRLVLCRTRRHRTDRLLLHFHVTSAVIP
jgi:hypothetical protein